MTPGMDLLGEIPEDCIDKKCLVLDLDETLVHSWFKVCFTVCLVFMSSIILVIFIDPDSRKLFFLGVLFSRGHDSCSFL